MKKVYSEIWDCCNKINDDIEDVMRDLIMEWMGEEEREGVLDFYEEEFKKRGKEKLFNSWKEINKVLDMFGKEWCNNKMKENSYVG